MRREYAYYTTERSQLTKLSAKDADMLGDAMVTVLTETKIRGRAGVYAEYMFSLPDGVMRRLSAKEKMTAQGQTAGGGLRVLASGGCGGLFT